MRRRRYRKKLFEFLRRIIISNILQPNTPLQVMGIIQLLFSKSENFGFVGKNIFRIIILVYMCILWKGDMVYGRNS